MDQQLAKKIFERGYVYAPIEDETSLRKIHTWFFGYELEPPMTPIEFLYYAIWLHSQGQLEERMTYWQQGAEMGEVRCIYALGWYAETEEKDFSTAISCYQRAGELGCLDAWLNLGYLYQNQRNWPEMIRYFLRCLEESQLDPYFNPKLTAENYHASELSVRYQQDSSKCYRMSHHELSLHYAKQLSRENLQIVLRYQLDLALQAYLQPSEIEKYQAWLPRVYLPTPLAEARDATWRQLYRDLSQTHTYFRYGINDINRKIFEYLFEQAYQP